MKKLFMLTCWVLYIVLSACSSEPEYDPYDPAAAGQLNINLSLNDDALTRADASYTTAQTYEKQVNSVQILVFDSSGALNVYKDAGTATSNISIGTTTGTKTVWAVVNGPDLSAVADLDDLTGTAILLGDNSTTASSGFVMAGSKSVTVTSSGATASVTVSRFVSRVALRNITNLLPESYGSLKVDYVMLINVPGNQNIAGNASISTWYNKMGRRDGTTVSSEIIDGSTHKASCPTLTFKTSGSTISNGQSLNPSTPYLFYCYPNPTTTDATGWSSTFTPRKTRLVVAATISGVRYYYPVIVDELERNTAYTIGLTITGLGSSDPDKPVTKGSLMIDVTVKEWVSGGTYDEVI